MHSYYQMLSRSPLDNMSFLNIPAHIKKEQRNILEQEKVNEPLISHKNYFIGGCKMYNDSFPLLHFSLNISTFEWGHRGSKESAFLSISPYKRQPYESGKIYFFMAVLKRQLIRDLFVYSSLSIVIEENICSDVKKEYYGVIMGCTVNIRQF